MYRDSHITINLESLLTLGAQLNESNDENSILSMALLSLMGKLKIFRGIVFVPDQTGNNFCLIQYKGKSRLIPNKNLEKIEAFQINQIGKIDSNSILIEAGYDICVPVHYRQELLAMICLSKKLNSSELSDEEYYYASLVSNITGYALKNTRNIKLLINEKTLVEQRNQLLTTLFEVSRDFNIFLSQDKIIKALSYNLLGQLMITRFALVYFEERINQSSQIKYKNPIIIKNLFKNDPNQLVLNELLTLENSCFTVNMKFDSALKNWAESNKVEIISPMNIQGDSKGCLLIGRKIGNNDFTNENLLFIDVIGNTAILAIENLKLIEKEVERQKLENELAIALEIQKKLLPKQMPELKGFDIYGMTNPSRFVGGDYFDFIKLPNNNLLLAIADVSGKGIPAALLMANVQAALRVLAPLSLPMDQMVDRINNIVYHNTGSDRFVTFFCAELNPENGLLKYVNAGHNPPFYFSSEGEIKLLKEGGILLGVLEEKILYQIGEIQLNKADIILMFTDGVTEALDENHREFGDNKVIQILKSENNSDAKTITTNILNGIKLHCNEQPQYDDITMIVLKVNGE